MQCTSSIALAWEVSERGVQLKAVVVVLLPVQWIRLRFTMSSVELNERKEREDQKVKPNPSSTPSENRIENATAAREGISIRFGFGSDTDSTDQTV
jgi:hypothetical protein